MSAEPVDPITRAPARLASCTAMVPTAPEAADTSRVSPACRRATLCKPAQAVMPGMPRAPRKSWEGSAVAGKRVSCSPLATKASRQPSMLLTASPTLKSG
ncbi:hypothetical protein D3C76_353270 [compost metagenome]